MKYIIFAIIGGLLLGFGISVMFESSRNESLTLELSEINQQRADDQRDADSKILNLKHTVEEVNDSLIILYDEIDDLLKQQGKNAKYHAKDEKKHIKDINSIKRWNDAKRDGLWTEEFAKKDSLIR